jgi:DNA segregation ATPase FtsK/SpoIIIE, S-DNA-T family
MGARPFSTRTAPAAEPARTPSRAGPVEAESAVLRRGREAAALCLVAVALFLALSLASYRADPYDPGMRGSDWMGPVGSAVVGFLVQGFGLVAWLMPLELALIGAPLLKGRVSGPIGVRLFGDLIVAIILAALVRVSAPELLVFGRAPAPGNVGMVFGELMRGLFSAPGSYLVGATAVGLILIGRSSFSFIRACRRAGELFELLAKKLLELSRRLALAWREARVLRREQQDAERAAAEPRIETVDADAAIIAQISDDDDWVPVERTGTPPLALTEALRAASDPLSSALLETPTGTAARVPPVVEIAPPAESVAPPPVEPKPKAPSAAKPAPEMAAGPRIVDTKPQQEVVRGKAKRSESAKAGAAFKLPPTELLQPPPVALTVVDRELLLQQSTRLEKTLADYGVSGKVEEIHPGPTVTTYEVAPEAGTKVSRVASLSDDLALGLSRKVRIIAPIPGKSRIGFELPNDERVPVNLRELIEDKRFEKLAEKAPLPVVLGRDHVGAPFYADLASMPHVIVAGATGAGKSVGLNVMLSSLLFCRTPAELRFLMVDPKVVELAPFDGIPHMLLPVVTDMKQAATALRWAVNEMERRYQLFADAGTKNIGTYNQWVSRVVAGEIPAPAPEQVQALGADGAMVSVPAARDGADGKLLPHKLPFIVIVVDEFADLMMQQGKEVETSVARLAQKARAAGMHVVLATQRPSVDVITGMIKANFPSRIAFRVAQKVDSRTILDDMGAELLLGKGDMLVKLNGSTDTRRVQCPFVSEEEVSALTDKLRQQGSPEYHDAILEEPEADADAEEGEPLDPRFDEAVRIVAETQRCSTSWLQRKMTIGYNRAAKIVEMMEKQRMVGPPNGARDREVLVPPPS